MSVALTEAQERWLNWLREHGGSAVLDRYGRLVAEGETASIGAAPAWLGLLAKGWITGRGGRIYATTPGAE